MMSSVSLTSKSAEKLSRFFTILDKVDRLRTTKRAATVALWAGIIMTATAIALLAAASISGQLTIPISLYGNAALGGGTLIALITYIAARYLHSRTEKKLSGKDILEALVLEKSTELVRKMGTEGFKKILQLQELKNYPQILPLLIQYPDRIAANLLYINSEVTAKLLETTTAGSTAEPSCSALLRIITEKINRINTREHTEAFYLYGAISEEFGKSHPICHSRGYALTFGTSDSEFTSEFIQAVSSEIETLKENLRVLVRKHASLKETVDSLIDKIDQTFPNREEQQP